MAVQALTEILKQFGHEGHPSFPALAEEAAYDVLIRHGHFAGGQEIVHLYRATWACRPMVGLIASSGAVCGHFDAGVGHG